MSDTVDLIVVGVETDIPRAKLSEKLVSEFKQEAYMFEALLDGAYGESAPYAAQSDVQRGLAEEGKDQLEKLGLRCVIVATGEPVEMVAAAPPSEASAVPSVDADSGKQAEVGFDTADDAADKALAAFKASDDDSDTDSKGNDSTDLGFDADDFGDADSALASFKKADAGKEDLSLIHI